MDQAFAAVIVNAVTVTVWPLVMVPLTCRSPVPMPDVPCR